MRARKGRDGAKSGKWRRNKKEVVKWVQGISDSFVEFVFVGSGVNGLMCLRTLGPV